MPFTTHSCRFSLGEQVRLDEKTLDGPGGIKFGVGIVGIVTGIMIKRAIDQQIEISWINDGNLMTAWVDDTRLTPLKEPS